MTELDDEKFDEMTSTKLQDMSRTPASRGWPAGDSVRRTVVVRRRWRWGLGAGVVVVAAAVTALSVTTGTSGGTPDAGPTGSVHVGSRIGSAVQLVSNAVPITEVDRGAVDSVVAAEQRLGLALLDKLGGSGNVSVSPASLYLALGMLQNAARGATAGQIAAALQASGLSIADQNAGLSGLMQKLDTAAANAGITLDSANSLWQQRGFPIHKQFLATLAAYYRTGVWQVDYQKDMSGALRALNDWTSEQTHGKITKLFDQLDPHTKLVLANAIYFHASWATPFERSATHDATFTTGDGTPVQAKFMSGGPGLATATTDGYRAVQLPYQGGRFAALVVMPTSATLTDFVQGLTPAKIDSIATATRPGATVKLPRFTTTAAIDLKPVLTSLGMGAAFEPGADFSGLSEQPTAIGQAIQRVYLGVGELGTTAAAATAIGMVGTAMPGGQEVTIDHPFLFLVRDTKTGAILFASEIQNPTAG